MRILIIFFLITASVEAYAQSPVNAYAKVTGIDGTKKILDVSNPNTAYHTFAVGEDIIIMQMQDDVNGDATNSSTFGTLGTIKSAGLYEVARVASLVGGGSAPTSITITTALTNTYNFNTHSSVQVITLRKFGSPNYTTTQNITAVNWDGNVGGVIAIRVPGILTLAHNISADGAGFRGGAPSQGTNGGACDNTTYITATTDISGVKGEGIYKWTTAAEQYGRAKILNGGGGGNVHNAGGGGGGNVTAGGDGGKGYSCGTSSGGQGGISLNGQISKTRIFMGGGGGGPHQNNGVASNGTNGGGIILINANQLITAGTCGPVISANGTASNNSTANDGAGGAGAGGSIILDVNTFSVVSTCAVSVSANGGNGGRTNDAAAHGGGGGGAQGRVIYSKPAPTNVTTSTNNGTSGCSSSAMPCPAADQPPAPSGGNGDGISANNGSTPLPVSLLYFTGGANKESGKFELNWATATEQNNDFFTLERSTDGMEFSFVANIPGTGTSSIVNKYSHEDKDGYEKVYYYRLSQTDLDGTFETLKVIRVERDNEGKPEVWVYPNPARSIENVTLDMIHLKKGTYTVTLMSPQGAEIRRKQVEITDAFKTEVLELNDVRSGVYIVRITSPWMQSNHKLVVH